METPPADAVLESYIDEVSARAAEFCRLAKDAIGTPPTFAAEALRATWFGTSATRGPRLLLPWRVPVTSITSVVEDGVTLTANDDYRLFAGGILERQSLDDPVDWSSAKIVVVYAAGWAATLSTNAPPDLRAAIAEQVKYRSLLISENPSIRSEAEPDVYSATYALPGGDNIGTSGLLVQVESALGPYRHISI